MADPHEQAATPPKPAADAPGFASPKSAASLRSAAEAASDNGMYLEVGYERVDDDATIDEKLWDPPLFSLATLATMLIVLRFRSTFTASLSSSVMDYPMEHGRRYHAYQKGSYIFPNDEREQERLDVAHHVILRTLGGRFWLAPIDEDKVRTVLDIGTGTGSLANELGDALPADKQEGFACSIPEHYPYA